MNLINYLVIKRVSNENRFIESLDISLTEWDMYL